MEGVVFIIKRKCLLIVFCFCFFASYAQDCAKRLETARFYKDKNDYQQAVEWYQKVLSDCGDYDGKVKNELRECQSKIPSKKPSKEYVPVNQEPSGLISGTELSFDAKGGYDDHIRVTCRGGWFAASGDDWLEVSESGDYLVVHCFPNTTSWARNGEISVIADGGTSTSRVFVQQGARKSSSYSSSRANAYAQETISRLISVTVSFEEGKSMPSFDKVGKMMDYLESNESTGLQIEIPWYRNQYNMRLIEKRIDNITDYLVRSGIDRSRISQNITVVDVNESDSECDRAYLKITGQASETQKNMNEDEMFRTGEKHEIVEISDVLSKTKILFDVDQDIPKIEDYNDNINKTVAILKANSRLKLIVEGYTDGQGSEEHNRDLAQRRANKVRELFIQKGVSPDQIETASYTVNDPQNRQNILDSNREEHNAAIFRIVKRY